MSSLLKPPIISIFPQRGPNVSACAFVSLCSRLPWWSNGAFRGRLFDVSRCCSALWGLFCPYLLPKTSLCLTFWWKSFVCIVDAGAGAAGDRGRPAGGECGETGFTACEILKDDSTTSPAKDQHGQETHQCSALTVATGNHFQKLATFLFCPFHQQIWTYT